MEHPLHLAVAKSFLEITKPWWHLGVKLDEACMDKTPLKGQHLPFFLSVNPSNPTKITNVDLMIVKENKTVKLVCEIEESDITPIRTFGKVFTAAAAIMCRINDKDKSRFDVDKKGIFIQVLNKDIPDGSKKEIQGTKLEEAINDILWAGNSWIKEYHLIYGKPDCFKLGNHGYNEIEKILTAMK